MRARWHRRAPRTAVRRWQRDVPLALVLRPVNVRGTFRFVPDENARFLDPDSHEVVQEAFRHRDGGTTEVHPRILELVYRAVLRFDAPYVHVVSGYRDTRRTSRHNQGRAVDMVFPGVPDRRLARFFYSQGFVGVGVYPTSGFVHLDVRERSYFWVDRSGPGQRQRRRQILRAQSSRADSRAIRRGEELVPDLEFAEEEPSEEQGEEQEAAGEDETEIVPEPVSPLDSAESQ